MSWTLHLVTFTEKSDQQSQRGHATAALKKAQRTRKDVTITRTHNVTSFLPLPPANFLLPLPGESLLALRVYSDYFHLDLVRSEDPNDLVTVGFSRETLTDLQLANLRGMDIGIPIEDPEKSGIISNFPIWIDRTDDMSPTISALIWWPSEWGPIN